MISVIIPTLNEGNNLAATLERINTFKPAHEVLVVDAGSDDATVPIATRFGSTILLSPVRQRAAQMNLGTQKAQGQILLFLHADTILPQRAFERINQALERPGVVGGAFRRYFLSESFFLQMTCRLAIIRNAALGWHLGDQGMFATAKAFEQLRGFKDMDRFEDLDFSRRLAKLGKLVTIKNPVLTSARRFEKGGPIKTTARDFWWTVKYLSGNLGVTKRKGS